MQVAIGGHTFLVEGDVLQCMLQGDFTAQHARELFVLLEQVQADEGSFVILADISQMGTIDAAARRWMALESRRFACRATAMYGASLPARTVITLLLRSLALFRPTLMPLHFAKTEQEARLWLEAQRPAQQIG